MSVVQFNRMILELLKERLDKLLGPGSPWVTVVMGMVDNYCRLVIWRDGHQGSVLVTIDRACLIIRTMGEGITIVGGSFYDFSMCDPEVLDKVCTLLGNVLAEMDLEAE